MEIEGGDSMRIFLKNLAFYLLSIVVCTAFCSLLMFGIWKVYDYAFTNVFVEGKYFDQFTADFFIVLLKPLGMVFMIGGGIGSVYAIAKGICVGFIDLVKDTIRENRERKLAKESIGRNPHITPDHLRSAPRDSVHAHTARNDRTAPQHFTHGYRSLDHER